MNCKLSVLMINSTIFGNLGSLLICESFYKLKGSGASFLVVKVKKLSFCFSIMCHLYTKYQGWPRYVLKSHYKFVMTVERWMNDFTMRVMS